MVNTTRDKPQLPTAEDVAVMERDATVKEFLYGGSTPQS
jgi:hypothetical protein